MGSPKNYTYKIGYPSLIYPEISLGDLLERGAIRYNKTAIIYADPKFPSDAPERITFKELNEITTKIATSLQHLGVKKGEKVGVCIPNSPDYVISVYSLWKIGAVVVPINPMYKEVELEYILNDSEATTLIIHSMVYPVFEKIRDNTKVERIIITGKGGLRGLVERGKGTLKMPEINSKEDLAALPYTGGTTGLPKGVMLTHFNLVSNALQLAVAFGLSHMDTHVGSMPMFHMAEFGFFNIVLAVGATYVVMGRFDPKLMAENIEMYEATVTWLVPPALNQLVNYLESSEKTYDWKFLRVIATGAWPVAPVLIDKIKKLAAEKCNNQRLQHNQVWGMTEASPMVTTNPLLRLDKSHTQGIPLSDIELKVIDTETGKELNLNESGEIVIRGPNVFKGYWKREKENEECWWYDKNGKKFFRTGDIGYIDDEGFLHFQDRVKEVIKYKGYTIAPFELESLLIKHEAVMDAAVIGKPDPETGEIPKAFVILKPEYRGKISKEEIIEWVKNRISGYKRIREVEFVEELPRTPAGKLLRRVLREMEMKRCGA